LRYNGLAFNVLELPIKIAAKPPPPSGRSRDFSTWIHAPTGRLAPSSAPSPARGRRERGSLIPKTSL